MATKAKSNAAQKAILAEITKTERYVFKMANAARQHALVVACRKAGEEKLCWLWLEYKAAA